MIEISNKWRRLKKEYSILVSDDLEKSRKKLEVLYKLEWYGILLNRRVCWNTEESESSIAISQKEKKKNLDR